MPRFSYTVRDKDGKKQAAVTEAKDEESLLARLQGQGLFVIKVSAEKDAAQSGHVSSKGRHQFTHSGVKLNDLVVLSRQIATMLAAGVPLLKTLSVILEQVESKVLFTALSQVRGDLERGSSFSNALSKHPRIFSQFWSSLVEVGEASGNLPLVLERMAKFLEDQAAFQRKIVSSLMYPAVLAVVAIGAISFFGFKIIPKFNEIFSTFDIQLPLLTRIVLGVFNFIQKRIFFLLFMIVASVVVLRSYMRTSVGRKQVENMLFHLPLFGNFMRVFIIERFTSQMSILVESGVPILYALEITQRMVGSSIMEGVIDNVKTSAREGQLIADALGKSGFFTPMVVQMVLIGEETGELGNMLKRVSAFYQAHITTFVERLTSLIEPIMLVVMGGFIGVIVISMFLPIFSIATLGGH